MPLCAWISSRLLPLVYNQVRFNTILAGTDPVAVDHVSAKLMGLNPDDVAHITLAEKVGLGTNDPEKINLLGIPFGQAMKKVRKNGKSDGRFGQSNRTWILSQAFEGSEISKVHFADEASIEPIPGEGGWSLPVYFFDDRIDLHAYYAGQTGIVSYAFTYFNAEKAQEAELWLGTQEGIQVSLNGEQVFSTNSVFTYGDRDRENKIVNINVLEGRNTLLVKTVNNFGDYSFALNICEIESNPDYIGNRLPGLKFYMDESGTSTTIISGLPEKEMNQATPLECFPNPASDYVGIRFRVKKSQRVAVQIYDLSGRLVKSFGKEYRSSGMHELTWNLESNQSSRVSSGTYICNLQAGKQTNSIKLVVE